MNSSTVGCLLGRCNTSSVERLVGGWSTFTVGWLVDRYSTSTVVVLPLSGEASARIFFAYFTEGFDRIDHSILMQEPANVEVYPALLARIAAFLTNRKQAVRIWGTLSDWKWRMIAVNFFNKLTSLPMCGFIAQSVGRASHRYHGGHGLFFFSF